MPVTVLGVNLRHVCYLGYHCFICAPWHRVAKRLLNLAYCICLATSKFLVKLDVVSRLVILSEKNCHGEEPHGTTHCLPEGSEVDGTQYAYTGRIPPLFGAALPYNVHYLSQILCQILFIKGRYMVLNSVYFL